MYTNECVLAIAHSGTCDKPLDVAIAFRMIMVDSVCPIRTILGRVSAYQHHKLSQFTYTPKHETKDKS